MSLALPCRWLLALGLLLGLVVLATACPFCTRDGKSLSAEMQDAAFVVYGRIANARTTMNADGTETSSTELHIEEVLKSHDFLRGKKMILLPRYFPLLDEKQPDRCVIFCHCYEGRVDPYLMFAIRDKHFLNYLRGSLGNKQEDRVARVKFFFDHLDHENTEIAIDAYREFSFASYKDVRDLVDKHRESVRGTKLLQWFQNRNAHAPRLGFFGMMLGLAGKPEDAAVLRDALQDPSVVTGIDGMLAGHVMLDRKAGWASLVQMLGDRSVPYLRRYAGLRTLKFFLQDHPGLVPEKDIWAGFGVMLENNDLADVALNDLRHARHWSHLDRILALEPLESHQTPFIRKALLQYMLRCPHEKAKQYVARLRQADPKRVQNAEEDLLYDQ